MKQKRSNIADIERITLISFLFFDFLIFDFLGANLLQICCVFSEI